MDIPVALSGPEEPRRISVVLCGMGAVGKSTMCLQAASEDHNTLFSTCEKHLTLEGSGAYVVMLKDTQWGPELLEARKRAYTGVDVVFLVYSVIQPDSLQAAKTTILAELREFAPLAPNIKIGHKTDMRADEDVCERLRKRQMAPLTQQDGEKAAQQIGALGFFEVSCVKDRDPLEKVFREGLLLVFGPPKQKKPGPRVKRLSMPHSNSNQEGGSMQGKNCALQ